MKGILKNKADQQLMIPHAQYPSLFSDGGIEGGIDVLNDNFYTQFHEMAFIDPQQMQQILPLNIINCNRIEQQQQPQQIQCQTLPRHLDVVPFDTVPPCDDCLKRARYKGSYGTQCQGTSGAECIFMHNQEQSSLTSTFRRNCPKSDHRRGSCEEKSTRTLEEATIGRRTARTSIVTADVEFDPTTCGDPSGNIVHEPDTLELVDTVESSV